MRRRLFPIIVSFDTSGVMRPVRIQIDKDIYSVSMCYLVSTDGPNVTYICNVQCGHIHGTIDITYNKHDKNGIWSIKMAVNLIPESVKRIQNMPGQEVVPVLATYNTDGQIKPLHVRINGIVF